VGFRDLTDTESSPISDKEDALSCAGSAKSETGHFPCFSYLRAMIPMRWLGLPLIALCNMLRAERHDSAVSGPVLILMSARSGLLPVVLGGRTLAKKSAAASREAACRLNYFVAENAKTARAELKRIGHPVPLRELAIEQLALQCPRPPNRGACWRLCAKATTWG